MSKLASTPNRLEVSSVPEPVAPTCSFAAVPGPP